MKDCAEYAALLDLYVDGALSPEEMRRVRAHLDDCPDCRAYVDDALAIRAAFPAAEDTEVPDGFADRVMDAVRAEAAATQKKKAPWGKVLLPLAACCALVILLQSGVFQGRGSSNAASAMSGAASPRTADTEEAAEAASEPEIAPFSLADSGESETNGASFSTADKAPLEDSAESEGLADTAASAGDGWVEYGNVVFSGVVYLTPDYVGDALEGYEGSPYSNANYPETGVIGIGYALDPADFERILAELGYPLGPMLNQDHTTEQSCIVVTENPDWAA